MFHVLGLNVARGKLATQGPATFNHQTPNRAVDGASAYNNDDFCSYTTQGNTDNPAWWQVDLGDTYRVKVIRIYNMDPSGR